MRWLALVLIACVLGGCTSVSDDAQDRSLAALDTQEPKPAPAPEELPATAACKKHPFRSLPPSRLPAPGHMPRKTFMRTIQNRGYLVAGVDQNTLQLGYFNPIKNQRVGFDIDLVREVANAIFGKSSDRVVHYKAISTKQRESVIETQDVDIVASAFTITCERRRRVAFSSVYHRARQRLLVPIASHVSGLDDLRRQRVCATDGSTSIKRLKGTGVVPFPVALRPDCLVALQEGQVAAITSDDAILFGFEQQDPQTKIAGPCLRAERYGLAMNKAHNDFVGFVNGVLERLRRSGDLKDIRTRWLGGLKPPPGDGRCR
jgi:polar amino acid transport system substrate-binding protein